MRDPRPGAPWSRARITRRGLYGDYMTSLEWWVRREEWVEHWRDRYGIEPYCLACTGVWALRRGDLHHRTYDRLGHERFEDLIPLDRDCHNALHRILDTDPSWQRMGLLTATTGILTVLRRRHSRAGANSR